MWFCLSGRRSLSCRAALIVLAALGAAVRVPRAWAEDKAADSPAAQSQPAAPAATQPTGGTSADAAKRPAPQTPEEREALIKEIRERAAALAEAKKNAGGDAGTEAAKRDKAMRVTPQRAKTRNLNDPTTAANAPEGERKEDLNAAPIPDSKRPAGLPQPPRPTTAPAAGGCGDHGALPDNLQPPPEDQPQPKLVVDHPRVEVSVWRGEPAVFDFKLKNGGEAPLNIQLRGG
jgi:hypothetical protein